MTPTRPIRLAFTLWLVAGVAMSVRTFLRPDSHTVFPVFAGGAIHWWADESLYADYAPLDFFRYPPALAVFFTPLAWLGPRVGGIVWGWLNLGIYGAGLWVFARRVLPVRWTDTRFAAYLALGLFGGMRGLWNGQSNALVIGVMLLGAAAILGRRWWTAAALLGTAIVVKLTPLAPVLLLATLWPRRLGPRLAVVLAVFALVPFLTRPPAVVAGHYRDWAAHLAASSHERWPGFRDAWTVWQVTRRYFEGEPGVPWLKEPLGSPAYRALQMATALAALAWVLRLRKLGLSVRELVTRTLAVGLAWLMLFGPSVEHATYVFLAPVLCWAFLEPGVGTGRRYLVGTAFGLVMVLGWGSLTRPLLDALPVLLTALPLGTGLFVGWLAAGPTVVKAPILGGETLLQEPTHDRRRRMRFGLNRLG